MIEKFSLIDESAPLRTTKQFKRKDYSEELNLSVSFQDKKDSNEYKGTIPMLIGMFNSYDSSDENT